MSTPLQSDRAPRSAVPEWSLVLLLTGAAAALQATRLPFRWNQICLAYASYFKEYQHSIEVEGWSAALTTFVGLHPPLYSLLFHGLETWGSSPLVWLSLSGALSVASVPVVWKAGRLLFPDEPRVAWLAAIVLAISPHRVAYGLEINNYPLTVFAISIQLLAFSAYSTAVQRSTGGHIRAGFFWAAATSFALWSHVLCATLPLAQVLVIVFTPAFRRQLRSVFLCMGATLISCLPLLPSLLVGGDAPPINQAVGILGALESGFLDFPGRYGSTLGAYLLGLAACAGALRLSFGKSPDRLVGRALVAHLLLTGTLVLFLVARGVAASHQFPYYLALLPTASLLIAAGASKTGPRLLSRATLLFVAAGLLLHAAALGTDALKGWQVVQSAPTERALMGRAIEEWTADSTLVLIDFPSWGDDDKDVLDATWALLTKTEVVDFAHPEVPTLVTADPYWGQPVRVGGNRWLYTFTGWPPSDGSTSRMDVIANHVLATGGKLIVALYNTDQAHGDFAQAEAWAMRRGELARSAPAQALWVIKSEGAED